MVRNEHQDVKQAPKSLSRSCFLWLIQKWLKIKSKAPLIAY